jgi:hypothetical protein
MTINSKYFRTRRYARIRHARKLPAFLAGIASALSGTPAAHTVAPKHTSQIGPEATLTISGGSVVANSTVTLQGVIYKIVAALTEVFAAQTLTGDGTVVSNGDTVTIGTKVYTFQTTLTNVDGNVHIVSANASATLTNLFHAINNSGGVSGTDYAAATVANTQVVATNPTGTTVVLTAKLSGTAANSIATTEASTHLAFGGVTLTGGVAASALNEVLLGNATTDVRDNLVAAITGSGAAGKYQSNIVANTDYTASAVSTNVLIQSLVSAGVRPATLCTLSVSGANLSAGSFAGPNWTATTHGITEGAGPFVLTAATTLPAGYVAGTDLYVRVVDANTIALAVSREALRKGALLGTTTAGVGTLSLARKVTSAGVLSTLERGVKPRTAAAATDVDGL